MKIWRHFHLIRCTKGNHTNSSLMGSNLLYRNATVTGFPGSLLQWQQVVWKVPFIARRGQLRSLQWGSRGRIHLLFSLVFREKLELCTCRELDHCGTWEGLVLHMYASCSFLTAVVRPVLYSQPNCIRIDLASKQGIKKSPQRWNSVCSLQLHKIFHPYDCTGGWILSMPTSRSVRRPKKKTQDAWFLFPKASYTQLLGTNCQRHLMAQINICNIKSQLEPLTGFKTKAETIQCLVKSTKPS